MSLFTKQSVISRFFLSCLLLLFFATGCAYFGGDDTEEEMASSVPQSQPYYPKDFKEILIPDGLTMNRENTMFVKTNSFNGGILNFEGRIEVNSLTEFFENSMSKKGWKLSGSVKAQKNLLIFTQPGKTCMITISESKFNINTEVNVYISEEVNQDSISSMPLSME
ncbi:MAG: hypothetical protein KQH63_18640 [Desulfobulbaceae bacterium]|nr:hypothetical protein [Desulfobulbaceae bacterium]